jgi:predicted phage-related endonuclease
MAAAMNFLKSGKESSERENLRYEVVAERITNTFADKYMTSDMQWGVDQECAAKEAFENLTGLMVKDVGFIDHPSIDHCGVSPDGFVSDGSLIEVKCPKTKTHMKYVANQAIPPEYKPQMLLQSACTGKDVWFVSYDPRMGEGKDLFIKKYIPTPEELAEVEAAAEKFLAECDALFEFFNDESNYFDKGSF